MDITSSELADVIEDPFLRREIMRALEEADSNGVLVQSDLDLLLEHAAVLLLLNNPEVDGMLLLLGSDLAMMKMMAAANG